MHMGEENGMINRISGSRAMNIEMSEPSIETIPHQQLTTYKEESTANRIGYREAFGMI